MTISVGEKVSWIGPARPLVTASGVAHGVPGTEAPATSFTMAIFDSAFEPFQRSRARVRARRTRLSSNGFFS